MVSKPPLRHNIFVGARRSILLRRINPQNNEIKNSEYRIQESE